LDTVSRKANLSVNGMTGNHLLLYRLAELMLEHEQHILPVDLLFDDEQIGDFVKSIQIDSPYQQMLLEGVLTESVREEMLYVSYTVEGYFHFVLGEVIYDAHYQRAFTSIASLLKGNKLIGIESAIEICLSRDNDSDLVIHCLNLLKEGVDIKIITNPISNFLIRNTIIENTVIYQEFVQVLSISNPLHNELLKSVILRLRKLGRNEIIRSILKGGFSNLSSKLYIGDEEKLDVLEILLSFSSYLDFEECSELCDMAVKFVSKSMLEKSSEFYSSLAMCLKLLNRASEALVFFENALSFNNIHPEREIQILGRIANCHIDISLELNDVRSADKSILYFRLIHQKMDQYPDMDPILKATQLNNYAKAIFVFYMKKWNVNFSVQELKNLFEESYELTIKNNGLYSDLTAKILNNVSMFYAMIGDLEKSLRYCLEGYKIVQHIYPLYSNDTAIFAFNIGNRLEQMNQLFEANKYYEIAYDINKKEGRLLINRHMSLAFVRVLKKLSFNDLATEIESQISIT
jgi:tetratricopeptide (TPR) repeat protein